jgi:hypothetical protein
LVSKRSDICNPNQQQAYHLRGVRQHAKAQMIVQTFFAGSTQRTLFALASCRSPSVIARTANFVAAKKVPPAGASGMPHVASTASLEHTLRGPGAQRSQLTNQQQAYVNVPKPNVYSKAARSAPCLPSPPAAAPQ